MADFISLLLCLFWLCAISPPNTWDRRLHGHRLAINFPPNCPFLFCGLRFSGKELRTRFFISLVLTSTSSNDVNLPQKRQGCHRGRGEQAKIISTEIYVYRELVVFVQKPSRQTSNFLLWSSLITTKLQTRRFRITKRGFWLYANLN